MSKISAVIQKMQNDIEYRTYFFKNAPKYQKLYLWLKPLDDKGYFSPEHNPKPQEDPKNKGYFKIPHWQVLDFLEEVAIQNKQENKREITELLLYIVNSVTNYRDVDGHKIDNYRTDWYMIKILFHLPPDNITADHIDFIGTSIRESKFGSGLFDSGIGETVLPVLIENKMKEHLLHLLHILFEYKKSQDSFKIKERLPIIEKYWLYEITKNYSKPIAGIVGLDGIKIFLKIMIDILSYDHGAFNIIWVSTIEENKQNSFPDRYDNQIVSFVRDMLEENSPNGLNEVVKDLIAEDHPIFKRLALHTLNYHYEALKSIFWVWFKSDDNILGNMVKHELYKLLDDRIALFSDDEIDTVIGWVESLDYSEYYKDRTSKQIEIITAYRKKEWLLTIKDYSLKANELYKIYNELAPEEIEHPGYDYWNGGVRRLDKSPLKPDENLCEKSTEETKVYINSFDPDKVEKDPLINKEDWIEGLAGELGSCIQNNPQKYVSTLEKFFDLDLVYFYYIFDGLERAWKDKRKFDWEKVFDCIDSVLSEEVLHSDEKYAIWVKGKVSELIHAGTASDENAFEKEHLIRAKKILLNLLNNPEEDEVSLDNLLSYSLNATNGKVLHALMNYALRFGRLNSDKDVKWEDDIKNFFNKQLDIQNNYSLYIFNILGEYLPNFRFLDRKWVNDNMKKFFPMDNNQLWEASFMGYMFSSTMVYQKDYEFFIERNDFEKALSYGFHDEHIKEKVLQFIVVAYFNNFDKEIIFKVLSQKDLENNLQIIRFIWHLYRDDFSGKAEFVYKIWETIYNLYKDDQSDAIQDIFSTLSKWFVFIEKIDETNVDWLKTSAQFTERNYNSYFVIEELLRLVDHNAKYAGEIYLEMLNNDVFPIYKEEYIVLIVERLFQLEEFESARTICNKYAANGIYFLNEIIKKYNF